MYLFYIFRLIIFQLWFEIAIYLLFFVWLMTVKTVNIFYYCDSSVLVVLVAQLCPTVCDAMDCSPPGSSVHGDSPGKNTLVGCHTLLQGIFPTQGSNPGLQHCRVILYWLSHQRSPYCDYATIIHLIPLYHDQLIENNKILYY